MLKILCIVTAIVLAIVVTRLLAIKNADFRANAVNVQGVVTGLVDRAVDRKSHNNKDHYIQYRFEANGAQISGEDRVEFEDLWKQVKVGDEIAIYYSPENPKQNHPVILIDRRLGVAEKLGIKAPERL